DGYLRVKGLMKEELCDCAVLASNLLKSAKYIHPCHLGFTPFPSRTPLPSHHAKPIFTFIHCHRLPFNLRFEPIIWRSQNCGNTMEVIGGINIGLLQNKNFFFQCFEYSLTLLGHTYIACIILFMGVHLIGQTYIACIILFMGGHLIGQRSFTTPFGFSFLHGFSPMFLHSGFISFSSPSHVLNSFGPCYSFPRIILCTMFHVFASFAHFSILVFLTLP